MTGLDVPGDPLARLVRDHPNTPIVVVNLVRLREGGQQAHRAYLEQATPIMKRHGDQPTTLGPGIGTLIGDQTWDRAAITTYPSARALADFISDPDFEKLAPLRHQALQAGIVHVFLQPDASADDGS